MNMMNIEEINNLAPGDTLRCLSNTGLWSVGDIITVWRATAKSINISGSTTGWRSKENFRWEHFELYEKATEVPSKILEFQRKVEEIRKNNKRLLKNRKEELENN